jgi:putative ABC transport system permease protein
MWTGHFKSAIASLKSSKGRSFLTMLGIIIGITSVVTIVSLGEGFKHKIVGQVSQLGSNVITLRSGKLVSTKDGTDNLNLLALLSTSTISTQDYESLTKLKSIDKVAPIDFIGSSASSEDKQIDNISVLGTTDTLADILKINVEFGGFISSSDANSNIAVIGSAIAKNLYGPDNPIGHTIKIYDEDFIIHGVVAKSASSLPLLSQSDFNSAIFIPLNSGKKLVSDKDNIVQILSISKDIANPEPAIAEIRSTILKNHHQQDDFSVLKQTELLNLAGDTVSSATGFVTAIAAIALLVGGIGIMDIMLANVSERTREIGIRKALGASNRQIRNQFVVEGLTLSIGGGLLGVIVSLIINLILKLYTNLDPIVTLPVIALAVGVSIILGVLFSVAPALNAARKDPIRALRGE